MGGSHRARNVGSKHVTRQQGASQCCGSADFPEWLPSLACSLGHAQVTPISPFEFPVQGWGPSSTTSCVITISVASVSSSQNGMMLSVPLRALHAHSSGGTEASLLTSGPPISALRCTPVGSLSESTFSSSPFLQTSLPEGPLISPLSQLL